MPRFLMPLLALVWVSASSHCLCLAADPRSPDFLIEGEILGDGILVELLTIEEAKKAIIDPSDPFFAKLTPLEISLRLDEDVTALPREEALAKFRTFLQGEVMEWSTFEKRMLEVALPLVAQACRERCPEILPKRWRFLRTTGREELGAPYTRGDCIVIPDKVALKLITALRDADATVIKNVEALGTLVVHETVHVWTRNHPIERDALYREIGFNRIEPVTLHPSIEKIRLTNPDGPGWEHAITVRDPAGEECNAILLLTSRAPEFQKGYAGVIPVLSFHLYPVTAGAKPTLKLDENGTVVRWRQTRRQGSWIRSVATPDTSSTPMRCSPRTSLSWPIRSRGWRPRTFSAGSRSTSVATAPLLVRRVGSERERPKRAGSRKASRSPRATAAGTGSLRLKKACA